MSYEIIYARQFIKVEQEKKPTMYMPFSLTGSNNCTELGNNGRERRARSWWNWRYYLGENKYMGTLDDMLKVIKDELDSRIKNNVEKTVDEIKNRWAYYTGIHNNVQKGDTYLDWQRFFINGVKNAITVEDLIKCDESVIVRTGYIYYTDKEDKMKGKELFNKRAESTEHLLSLIEEAKEYHKDLDVGYELDLTLYNDVSAYKRIRQQLFPQKQRRYRNPIETKTYFIINIKGYGGFSRRLRGSGFKYTYGYDGGKKYLTEKQANRKVKDLQKYIGHEMDVKKIESNYTVYV